MNPFYIRFNQMVGLLGPGGERHQEIIASRSRRRALIFEVMFLRLGSGAGPDPLWLCSCVGAQGDGLDAWGFVLSFGLRGEPGFLRFCPCVWAPRAGLKTRSGGKAKIYYEKVPQEVCLRTFL